MRLNHLQRATLARSAGMVAASVILSMTRAAAALDGTSGRDLTAIFNQLHFNGESMSDYYTLGVRRAGLMINSGTGQKVSRWMTAPISPTRTDFTWDDPNDRPSGAGKPINIEEWSVKSNCAGGRSFVWLDAFRNDFADSVVHHRFKIKTSRAEIRIGNGPWVDITAGGSCGTDGQPYALLDVTTDPYSLRVWADIYTVDEVTVGRRFFWQATMSYVAAAKNPCWKQDANQMRPAIKQEEAWWDSTTGWGPGSGSIGANEQPDGKQVHYGRWQMIGKGAGDGWLGADSLEQLCLQTEWVW